MYVSRGFSGRFRPVGAQTAAAASRAHQKHSSFFLNAMESADLKYTFCPITSQAPRQVGSAAKIVQIHITSFKLLEVTTMATNIRIIHAHDFIKVTPDGQLDFENTKKLLIDIASATASLVDYEIILDTRKAQTVLSITDLWSLALELGNLRKAFSGKVAILCPLERFDYAGFFALCAQNRGFQVSAFTAYEDAIEWLNANRT